MPSPSAYEEFISDAGRILQMCWRERAPTILKAAESCPARWHPNGFAVFHLGPVIEELSWVRLHAWPRRRRVIRNWGPRIHCHGWHLASHVIQGTYRDEIYQVRAAEEELDEGAADGWREVFYHYADNAPDETDLLHSMHRTAQIRLERSRTVAPGTQHDIPSGVLHDTVVPDREMVATLVTRSPRMGRSLVVGPVEYREVVRYRRPEVSDDVREEILRQVRV